MQYTLAIYGAPYSSQACQTALNFARAAIHRGHSIYRVFFYQDGVHTASTLAVPPQDESHLYAEWEALAKDHSIDMVICISAALRRGVLDEAESERYEKPHANMSPAFTVSGLGQLIDGAIHGDRLMTFGA
ncbi:sulfurtransferase complex subunit TusD [Kistimonas asteriae]|uniref:sulfurtransferase complex subunit TusD n=1 Tax=Kistimonas asteriae TaxID=517724 RepID=UPI001BA95338|nr:sulfurtransferase complex subunit TusD [Kistimonas asteriae]